MNVPTETVDRFKVLKIHMKRHVKSIDHSSSSFFAVLLSQALEGFE